MCVYELSLIPYVCVYVVWMHSHHSLWVGLVYDTFLICSCLSAASTAVQGVTGSLVNKQLWSAWPFWVHPVWSKENRADKWRETESSQHYGDTAKRTGQRGHWHNNREKERERDRARSEQERGKGRVSLITSPSLAVSSPSEIRY